MKLRRFLFALALFILLLGLLTLGIHTYTQNNTLGTDFFIFWQAGRGFLIEHSSPYDEQFAVNSQLAIFKRLAAPGEDQLGFAYPPFAILTILPLLFLSFEWASAIWLSILVLCWVAAVLWITRGKPLWTGLLIVAFYPAFFGLILGNFVSLAAALLAVLAGYYLFAERPSVTWQVIAGISTAWLLFKPQFSWLFILILFLNGLHRQHRTFLLAFAGGTLFFIAISFLIWPTWPGEWLAEVNRYAVYNQTWPTLLILLQDFIPQDATLVLGGIGVVILAVATLYNLFRWWFGRLPLLSLLAWTGLAAYLLHPHGKSYEHLVFLVPLLIWVCRHSQRNTFPVQAWWVGNLLLSWAVFFLSFILPSLKGVTDWPVLAYAAWAAWLVRRTNYGGYAQDGEFAFKALR